MGEEKFEWSEEKIAEYFGDEALVREVLNSFKDKEIPQFVQEEAKKFLEVVRNIKEKNERCEFRKGGMCKIKLRPCMYRANKMCPTYRNKGSHLLLSTCANEFGPKSLDLLTAHPFFEPLANCLDKALSSGDCPENIALALIILQDYLFSSIEDELKELEYLKSGKSEK